MFFRTLKSIKTVQRILGWMGGGVYKRIDENRELLELLRNEAPALIEKHPEIVSWIKGNDDFFMELALTMPPKDVQFDLRPKSGNARSFPRTWPFDFANDIRRRTVVTLDGKLELQPNQAQGS